MLQYRMELSRMHHALVATCRSAYYVSHFCVYACVHTLYYYVMFSCLIWRIQLWTCEPRTVLQRSDRRRYIYIYIEWTNSGLARTTAHVSIGWWLTDPLNIEYHCACRLQSLIITRWSTDNHACSEILQALFLRSWRAFSKPEFPTSWS